MQKPDKTCGTARKSQMSREERRKMNTNAPERWTEDFEISAESEEVLLDEVRNMEDNSLWLNGYVSSELRLIGIPSPMEAAQTAAAYGLEPERTEENARGFGYRGRGGDTRERATGLILAFQDAALRLGPTGDYKEYKNISRAAWGTLCETAKLTGSALGRMAPLQLADCLNEGLFVARGQSLLLLRYDKIMALHSDSECGYCVMPISELLEISRRELEAKFGTVVFREARHSNILTTALWELPDAKKQMLVKYQSALAHAASRLHPIDFMPAVRFTASDTARSSATLRPMFVKKDGTALTFGGDIAVKHEKKRSGICGVDLFTQEAGKLFAKFDETLAKVQEMAETEIYNPVNCTVGLFNFINRGGALIKRQYADAAREEVERFSVSSPVMSMHDIYISMSECVCAAKRDDVRNTAKIEEALSKVLTADWKAYDVGGLVAWGEKGAA